MEVNNTAVATSKANNLLKNLNCIAFDMDMTIVRYNNNNVAKLIFECLLENLAPLYPGLADMTTIDLNFCRRGLVIDMETGYFLKLDNDKRVSKAYDGNNQVDKVKVDEIYHKVPITDPESPFHLFDGNHTHRFISMITFFEIPMASIWLGYMLLLQKQSAETNKPIDKSNFRKFTQNIVKAYDDHFNNFYGGSYYTKFKKNPGNYVYKSTPECVQWLKELKSNGCKVLLITNSKSEYSDYLMTWSYGENYKELFDLIITDAHKPEFFKSDKPFINLGSFYPKADLNLDELKVDKVEFNKGFAYKGGNVNVIIKQLEKENGGNKMVNFCYVGDNLMGDVVAPKKYVNWLTVAIIEELMDPEEITVLQQHTTTKVLSQHSNSQWGSYFLSLNESTTTTVTTSFWSRVISDHADIVVSSVDQLSKYYYQIGQDISNHSHPLSPSNIMYG